MKKHWGLVKRVDGNAESTPIKLYKDTYYFGRSKGECEFSYKNSFLSKKHCFIQRKDDEKAKYIIYDQSSNGTLINFNQKINRNKIKLNDKDFIYLVYRNTQPEKNIILKFEICNEDETEKHDDLIDPDKSENILNLKRNLDDKIQNVELENDIVEKKEFENSQNADELIENITCTICNDIFHDCVSLQPCMHSYCGACYSDWMVKSTECPICRKTVERISKNCLINNIVESFLKKNSKKKRSDSEIKIMNEKNKIDQDMNYPEGNPKVEKFQDDYESDNDLKKNQNNENFNEDDNNDDAGSDRGSIFRSDNEDEDLADNILANNFRNNFPMVNPWFNRNQYFRPPVFNQPFKFTCRECPQNKLIFAGNFLLGYTCSQFQNHLLCQCCLEAFPDRTEEINRNLQIPRQTCSMCFTPYCNLYWGCNKDGCKKCLIHFKEFVPDIDCLKLLINENEYESNLFSNWIQQKNKKIEDIFQDCLAKLEIGKYKLSTINTNDPLNKIVCRKCATKLFRELAYQFRTEIPNEQIFDQRPDCHWGKECRTQKHNLNHSKKFNHVCEKTKF